MGLRVFPPIEFVRDRLELIESLCRDKVVLHLGCADALAVTVDCPEAAAGPDARGLRGAEVGVLA